MTVSSERARDQVDGRAARWAGQRERRRAEFVDAAVRAIAEHGPDVSVERIAEEAGVGRTRLYKYFADAADLAAAVARRAIEMLNTELAPALSPRSSPAEMIRSAIEAHIGWLVEHEPLYRYLSMHSLSARPDGTDAITDAKTAIAGQLAALFEYYLPRFGADTKVAEPVAFGVVGLVESSTARWLTNPGELTREELAGLLNGLVWRMIDDTLRTVGVRLDPDRPLAEAGPESGPA
ncbi:TetR/AcrR family transcriptional regulator [Sciscionella sediminilitoris]|uniref:TetR/AcrR family transcriptional regulator n=1 Tax=Sciscionella sediminilitoris TaxID=1445613 RepID=UPI0004DFC5F3|nr:TetR/AcrR family transcriptional regulator [Sciscionella sp. SE31]